MEEIYTYLLRSVLAVLGIVAVVWSALRYLVKYKVFKASHEMRAYADGHVQQIWDRVHAVEAEIYDLNIALKKLKDQLEELDRDSRG